WAGVGAGGRSFFFFSSRRRHTRSLRDWSSDVCSSDLMRPIFTGPPHDEGAHLRNAAVLADGAVDRSPCGAGTSAVMAVLDAMGQIGRASCRGKRVEVGGRRSSEEKQMTAVYCEYTYAV